MRRAVSFLTVLGGAAAPDAAALAWFPAAGALVGSAVGGAWWAADRLWPPAVAAAVALVADLALTGLLHADGLADAADGLLAPHADRERRLAAMADPAVGAFGLVTTVAVLVTRFAALVVAAPSVPLVAGLWCASRTAMAVTIHVLPYARPGGAASPFLDGLDGRRAGALALSGIAVAAGLAAWGRGVAGLTAVAAVAVTAAGVVALARRRLGGFTGDVLGAAGVVGETAGLLVVAGRWT
jgi:adenosylcobinamide-GDP ribazoletransferase